MLKVSRELRVGYIADVSTGIRHNPDRGFSALPLDVGELLRDLSHPSVVCSSSMWGVGPLADYDIGPWVRVIAGYTSTRARRRRRARLTRRRWLRRPTNDLLRVVT